MSQSGTDSTTGTVTEGSGDDAAGGTPTWARAVIFTAAALVLLLLGATVGLLIGRAQTAADEAAKPNAVDIGFCQDMSAHHGQAVEMGNLARDRGSDELIRSMGYDIASTQLAQVGRMQGWLTLWDAPAQATGELMAWMPDHSGHSAMPRTPKADDGIPMPGMATRAELRKLSQLSGRKFDAYFLQLMLRHHQGGTAMAEYTAKHAEIPAVRLLAQSMIDSQGAEMLTMKDMLAQLGAKPLPN